MNRTITDIRENLDYVGCDNQTAREMCDEIERLTTENTQLVNENIMQAATINGLRLPQTSMDGKTIPELVTELADAREAAREIWRDYNGTPDEIESAKRSWPWLEDGK